MYKITSDPVRRPPVNLQLIARNSQLELVSTQTSFFDPSTLFSDEKAILVDSPIIAVLDPEELSFELGVWLAGLESFIRSGSQAFDRNTPDSSSRDWSSECRLTHAALLKCSKLNFRLRKTIVGQISEDGNSAGSSSTVDASDLDAFTLVLRDAIVLNESVLRSGKLNYADWRSLGNTLAEKLASSATHRKLVNASQGAGQSFLPERLRRLLTDRSIPFADDVDLHVILPQFGVILGALKIVASMLKQDEPLKPSLIIFSRVYEQTHDLITHMNNRLSRFSSEGAAMFDSLDSASYTASLELKKVYTQELTGLVGTRAVPSVFARVETACELLSDSFRQILAGFARVIDPQVEPSDLFTNFQTKLEQSLALRQHLWHVLQKVQGAEHNPDKAQLD